MRFSAGLELDLLELSPVPLRSPLPLVGDRSRGARFFLNVSLMLYPLGSTRGALAIWVKGKDRTGQPMGRRIALVTDFDGPATPSCAAVILAKILDSAPVRHAWVRFLAWDC